MKTSQIRNRLLSLATAGCAILPPPTHSASAPMGPTGMPLTPGSYVAIDLGNFGTPFAQAFDLNNGAQVVGSAQDSNHFAHGFIWQDGVIRALPTLSGGTPVSARAINAVGEVAGTAWRPLPEGGTRQEGFRWLAGPLSVLRLPADAGSPEALDINDDGLIVGSVVITQAWSLGRRLITRPVSWSRGGGVSLLTAKLMAHGRAIGVSSAGQVVGTYQTSHPANQATHAVFFEAGGVRDIHSSATHVHSVATAVNSAGQVVGYSYSVDNRLFDSPFLWTEAGGMRSLPHPNTAPYGQALDITDNGLAVGYLRNEGPILWLNVGQTNETYLMVQGLLPPKSPYHLNGPVAVNKWGEIAATAGYEGTRAVLLTPTNIVDRVEGTFRLQTVSVEPAGFLVATNALVDVKVELLGLDGTNLVPIATDFTDRSGAFTLVARQERYQHYSTRFTFQDGKGWLDLYDFSTDTNQPAWLRTPAFDAGRNSRMDVVLGINQNSTNADPNDVTYFFNGNNTWVGEAGVAQPEQAAVNASVRDFPHLAVIYRNLCLAAKFAEETLGLDMPRIRIEAFTPGNWAWRPWQATANQNVKIRRGSWNPPSFFSYSANQPARIVFPDLRSLMNPPAAGFGVPGNTNGFSRASQRTNLTNGSLTLANGTLCGRDRPDNREFHEYSHYIMYVSTIGGERGFPPRGAGNRNHEGLANSTSADSWTEGWAEFLSAVISDVMLDRVEKPSPSEYRYDGDIMNLDDLMTYTNVLTGNEFEEDVVSSILWDLHDPPDPVEGDTLSLGIDQWWNVISATGPGLIDFHEVYGALANYALPSPPGVSPADLQDRWISSFVFDDLSLAPGDPSHDNRRFDPGEVVGRTSWNTNYLHRPARQASRFLQVQALTESGQPVSDVMYRDAIDYEPPFKGRNRLMEHATAGSGDVLVPLLLPPLPSRAVITAWTEKQAARAPFIVQSTEFWQAVAAVPDAEGGDIVFKHTFVFKDTPAVVRAQRLSDGGIQLSWEDTGTTWRLESTPSLNSPVLWTPVAATPSLDDGRWAVNQSASARTTYYRLRSE